LPSVDPGIDRDVNAHKKPQTMPVGSPPDTPAPAAADGLRRPAPIPSILTDAALAIPTYLLSYWLRFSAGQLSSFLPRALSTVPIVVVSQILGLAFLRAYSRKMDRVEWFLRVILGTLVGTAASVAVVGSTSGFEGISRMAFVADGALLTTTALIWRGVWALRTRVRVRAAGALVGADMVDRAAQRTTLGGTVTSLYRYRALLKNLVFKDLKLKYRGSMFGFLWSLVNPLLMIVIYTLAFTYIMRIRGKGFVFYLMLGQLSWSFFSNSATMSTGAIIDNAGLLKSVFFPRAILPVGTVLFNLAQYLLTAVVFLPAMLLWYQVPLSAPMLLYPVILALQAVFTIGIALMLATGTAFFRDIRHLLEVALALMFWTTPIVYELRQVPDALRLLLLLSPVTPFVAAYQSLFFYQEWPEPTVFLLTVIYAVGAFVVGATLHMEFEDRFTEQL
jgi:lipopolysaccharide transport system permease protein